MDATNALDLAVAQVLASHPMVVVTSASFAASAGVDERDAREYLAAAVRLGAADRIELFVHGTHERAYVIYPDTARRRSAS